MSLLPSMSLRVRLLGRLDLLIQGCLLHAGDSLANPLSSESRRDFLLVFLASATKHNCVEEDSAQDHLKREESLDLQGWEMFIE